MSGLQGAAGARRGRLLAVLAITVSVLVVEVIGGLLSHSLALLADAGHMFTDVAGLGLALGAIWFAARPANRGRTFGLYRTEILAAVINGVLLFGVAASSCSRRGGDSPSRQRLPADACLAWRRSACWRTPCPCGCSGRASAQSLNIRGAYLEVLGDLLGSVAVIVAALVIALTGFRRADPIASVFIGLLILPRTWKLLKDAVDVLLEATPKTVDLEEVRRHVLETPGVVDVHDLHAWSITSGMNVVSAHVVIEGRAEPPEVLDRLCSCLSGDFDIEHSTFQLELQDRRRIEEAAHP